MLTKIRKERRKESWAQLEALVEKKLLLQTDIAYAKAISPHASEQEAALLCALTKVAREGHLCLCEELLPTLPPPLIALLQKSEGWKGPFSLPKYQLLEEKIVGHVKRLSGRSFVARPYSSSSVLNPNQQKALALAATSSFSILTGGPGTGKTFTAASIVLSLELPTVVAAPTGKAATHLLQSISSLLASHQKQKAIPLRGGTLHSLLQVHKTKSSPPLIQESLMIVDECSMLDPFLLERLLSAISDHTTLILMGDPYQLSAVEGGSLFADLLPFLPTTTLTECMRSDKASILQIARQILQGDDPNLSTLDLGFKEGNKEVIYHHLLEYGKAYFPQDWICHLNAFRILTPLRIGPYGADALNALFASILGDSATEIPIMIAKNDKKTTLSNGELGVLLPQEGRAFFPGKGFFAIAELPPFEYAYCISVHKSQGSEYDHVLLLIPEGSEVFGKEILYTGVTRAKERVDIDGHPERIALALKTSSRKYSCIASKFLTL